MQSMAAVANMDWWCQDVSLGYFTRMPGMAQDLLRTSPLGGEHSFSKTTGRSGTLLLLGL